MPWNLPFQLEEGSHTSKRMSESVEGLMDPATRQKAGRLGMGRVPGAENSPGARVSALAMVVCGRARVERLSQVAAASGAAKANASRADFIRGPQLMMVPHCMARFMAVAPVVAAPVPANL